MDSPLKIFTEQLRHGKREMIEHVLPSDLLDLNEPDISFHSPVHLKGEAYETDEHLILHLFAHTEVQMPCSVCNQMTVVPLQAEDIYHTIPLNELKSTIFDFTDIVREELVLLIPQFVECQEGKCPERSTVTKFMKSPKVSDEHHFPFADL